MPAASEFSGSKNGRRGSASEPFKNNPRSDSPGSHACTANPAAPGLFSGARNRLAGCGVGWLSSDRHARLEGSGRRSKGHSIWGTGRKRSLIGGLDVPADITGEQTSRISCPVALRRVNRDYLRDGKAVPFSGRIRIRGDRTNVPENRPSI